MPRLADVLAVEATLRVDVCGVPVTVRYRPGQFTRGYLEQMPETTYPVFLSTVLVGWDLYEPDSDGVEREVPRTPESLNSLWERAPFLLRAVGDAVVAAVRPN